MDHISPRPARGDGGWFSLRLRTSFTASQALVGNGLGKVDAFKTEVVGMFWSGIAALKLRVAPKVCFRCDNMAALGVASGAFQAIAVPVVQALRSIHMCVAVEAGNAPSYLHVKGHAGDVANELADSLADMAARGSTDSGPFSIRLHDWFVDAGRPFQWATHATWSNNCRSQAPDFCEGVISWDRLTPELRCDPMDAIQPFSMQRCDRRVAGSPLHESCDVQMFVGHRRPTRLQAGKGVLPQAVLYLSFLRGLRLFAPRTFDEFSYGPSGTLCQRRNSASTRGDYLGVPESWKSHSVLAWVEPSISEGHQVTDHMAVVASIRVAVTCDPTLSSHRKLSVDQNAMFDPANKVDGMPELSWDIGAREHCEVITRYLQHELVSNFPMEERRLGTDYFSAHTTGLHQVLCSLRNKMRRRCQALTWARL